MKRMTALVAPAIVAAGLIAALVPGPALAGPTGSTPPAGPVPPPSGSGTSSTPPTYTATVLGNVNVTGDTTGHVDTTYTPPECWLQPFYHQPQSFLKGKGDPQLYTPPQSADSADSFYFSVASLYPGLLGAISHMGGFGQIDTDFEQVQNGQNDVPGGPPVTPQFVWWAPNWLQNAAGWACAQALISSANMNNGFLDLEPPAKPDTGSPGQITSRNLAALARASLRLPDVTVTTQPAATAQNTSTYVNLPTSVYVNYATPPGPQPSDTASVVFDGGTYLSATITTTAPQVQISTSDPGATVTDNKVCSQQQPCSVKFADPNAATPFTITATVTWTVTWTTSDHHTGTFRNPPSQVVVTRDIYVREIQAVNTAQP